MLEHFVAQRVYDVLPRLLQEHGLPIQERLVEHADCNVAHGKSYHVVEIDNVRLQVACDPADDERKNDVKRNVDKDKQRCESKSPPLGFQIRADAFEHHSGRDMNVAFEFFESVLFAHLRSPPSTSFSSFCKNTIFL